MKKIVLKIGGTLLKYPSKLKKLCNEISNIIRYTPILVIPGGGGFADIVRGYYKQYKLSEDIAHWMAILAMDQYGLLLSELIGQAKIIIDLNKYRRYASKNYIPIFLPFKYFYDNDPLPHSWEVTSDSLSLYIARQVNAETLILLKDVDGVYYGDKLIKRISLKWLRENKTCIDRYFPILAKDCKLKIYIVNGLYPKRLKFLIQEIDTVYTEILTDSSS